MHLLMIIPSFKKAGPVNVALSLCSGIKRINNSIIIEVLSLKSGDLESDFSAICDQVYVMSPYHAINFLRKSNKYNIIHSHCVLPDLINALFNVNNAKKFSTLHNYIDIDYIFEKGFFKGTLISCLHRFALRRMDKIISCSNSVSKFVFEKFSLMTTFVRNGVEEGGQRGAVEKGLRFIMVGVFNKRKNHEVAIKGFVDANKDNSELIVLGDGPYFNRIKDKFSNEKNVIFLGRVDNPRIFLSKSHVFLSSSCAEGLPMALIEAMSESLTYILSDIDPHREINNMNTSSGIIVNNDIKSFKNAISTLTNDEVVDMRNISKEVYNDNLTAEKMAIGYLEKYKGCLE